MDQSGGLILTYLTLFDMDFTVAYYNCNIHLCCVKCEKQNADLQQPVHKYIHRYIHTLQVCSPGFGCESNVVFILAMI